jgi:hypothetical protein
LRSNCCQNASAHDVSSNLYPQGEKVFSFRIPFRQLRCIFDPRASNFIDRRISSHFVTAQLRSFILIFSANPEISAALLAECSAGRTRNPMRHMNTDMGTYIAHSAADAWSSLRLGDGRVVRAAERSSSFKSTRPGSIPPE